MIATCLIVYTSMSGNTEEIANLIGQGIQEAGITVEIKDIIEVDVGEIQEHDGILLGAYTWGDGDLPDEFLDFYKEMDTLDLQGKIAAAFGSCSSAYELRGRSVDLLTQKLTERGAQVAFEGLKIDLAPSPNEIEQCITFGRYFSKKLTKMERCFPK